MEPAEAGPRPGTKSVVGMDVRETIPEQATSVAIFDTA